MLFGKIIEMVLKKTNNDLEIILAYSM